MSDSDTIALAGLVANGILTLFNAGVAMFIARKTLQATLPNAKLRERAIKRKKQHPLRKLIKLNRVEQVVCVLLLLLLFMTSFVLTMSGPAPVVWWSLAAVLVGAALADVGVFMLSEQIVRGLRRNLRPLARKLKQGRVIDLNSLP